MVVLYAVKLFSLQNMSATRWTEDLLRQRLAPFHCAKYSWSSLDKHKDKMAHISKAAVLIPLEVRNNDVYVWFTLRTRNVTTHKGHVCFPGGKKDEEDQDEIATSLRESHEEIGLEPSTVEIISVITPSLVIPPTIVTPVVGLLPRDFEPELNRHEVEKWFCLPLRRFLKRDGHDCTFVRFL